MILADRIHVGLWMLSELKQFPCVDDQSQYLILTKGV